MFRAACLCLVAFSAAGAPDVEGRRFTDDQWRQDIESYVQTVKTMHKSAFHAIDEGRFRAAVASVIAEVPTLSDQRIGLEMSRLAALIGDGHTWIAPADAWAPPRLPIVMFEFADGVFITRAMEGHSDLTGKQVLAIGGKPVAELLADAEAYTSRDNEWSLRARRVSLLSNAAFLEREGVATIGQPIELGLGNAAARLEVVPAPQFLEWVGKADAPPDNAPLYRQQRGKPYWVEYPENERAVYMRFSAVTNDPKGPHLVAFSEQLMELIEEKKPQKLIIDIRDNGGGNGDLLTPLVRRISENKRINRRGRLFVITNRITFSAALMFTVRMDRQTEALFAGEPGGGKPNSYSERTNFTLPITGMAGSISSRWHEEGGPGDTREFVPVDIPVPMTSDDYFHDRDPVLEAVLAYKP